VRVAAADAAQRIAFTEDQANELALSVARQLQKAAARMAAHAGPRIMPLVCRARECTQPLVVATSAVSGDTLSHRAPVAQLDRAAGFEPVGRGFDSLRAHHFTSFTADRRSRTDHHLFERAI
jgi:hypothetical protein